MTIESQRTDDLVERVKTLTKDLSELRGLFIGRFSGAMTGGSIPIRDPNGVTLVTLGLLSDGSYGIQINDVNGQIVYKVTSAGQLAPYQYLVWSSVAATYGTVSATYDELFRFDFSSTGPRVQYDINADNAGGTMDWKITIAEFGAAQVNVVEQIGASGQYAGPFTIPSSALVSGTDVVGRTMSMRLLARRTSGAGTPTLRLNAPAYNRPA